MTKKKMKFMNKTNERKKNAQKNNQDEQKMKVMYLSHTYAQACLTHQCIFFENKHTVNHKIDEIYF